MSYRTRTGRPRSLSAIPEEAVVLNENPERREPETRAPTTSHQRTVPPLSILFYPPLSPSAFATISPNPETSRNQAVRRVYQSTAIPRPPTPHPTMDSPSSSAPASSLRVDVTPIQSSSSDELRRSGNVTPSPAIRSSSSSDIRQLDNSANRRGRARYRSPAENESMALSSGGLGGGTMNLKLLTCHWWRTTGHCRHSSTDCLYAHHDTGRYADAPRQVVPGQPAVAGRNADRRFREAESQLHHSGVRLENTQVQNRSNSSLANLDSTNRNAEFHPFSAPAGGSFTLGAQNSRPSTPGGLMMQSPSQSTFPLVPNSPLHVAAANVQQLEGELSFFRTLVEQGGREKEVMVSTIENLQAENQTLTLEAALKASVESARSQAQHLTEERDALRATLTLVQQQTESRHSSMPLSLLRRTAMSSSWADFGAIGGRRSGSGGSGNANANGNASEGEA